MEVYTERFIFALTPAERTALAALAQRDGVSQAGAMRRLLRREARRHGLLPIACASQEEGQHNESRT